MSTWGAACTTEQATAVRATVLAAAVLYIKCFATALIQGKKKGAAGKGGARQET